VHPNEFWELTYYEKSMMFESYNDKKKEDSTLFAHVMKSAITSALYGTPLQLFKDENNTIEENNSNEIDVEVKQEELNKLKELFPNT